MALADSTENVSYDITSTYSCGIQRQGQVNLDLHIIFKKTPFCVSIHPDDVPAECHSDRLGRITLTKAVQWDTNIPDNKTASMMSILAQLTQ